MPDISSTIFSFLLILVLLSGEGRGANVATECNQQLFNYFVFKGMPAMTPMIQALNFTTGVFMGEPFVRIQFGFQDAARIYGNLLPNTTLANFSFTSWVSNNNPWCATRTVFECIDSAAIGTIKTSNCTTIIDTDPGGSDPVAGRYFLYANSSAACSGGPVVTYYNVSIIPSEQDVYTYDALGLRDHVHTAPSTAARNVYRSSYCDYSDGDPIDIAIQNQFVCVEPRVGCAATRSDGSGTVETIPVPQFRCIGNLTPNSTTPYVVWDIANYQDPAGVEGEYLLQFRPTNTMGNPPASFLPEHIVIPSQRGQFNSGFSTMDHYLYIYYSGEWTNYRPIFPLSDNPFVAQIPCICDFSVNCLPDGTIDFADQTMTILLSNVLPICDVGPSSLILSLGSPNFTLDATRSHDPDLLPYPFTLLWRIYSTPYDPNPPPFSLGNPMATTIFINSTSLIPGNYIFVLTVSDLQNQVPCTFNVTILSNQMFPIVQQDQIVVFDFYAGNMIGHSCMIYPPSPAIPVNGSWSYNTEPSVPMYYLWIQVSGSPLAYDCDPLGFRTTRAIFNTTEPVMWFVPPSVGLYGFQLILTDGVTNVSSRFVYIQVNPNFGQPNSTFTPLPNFTPVPTRLDSQSPIGHYPVVNLTFPPFNSFPPVIQPPPPNTTVPPIITILPPPTALDITALTLMLMGVLFLSLLALALWKQYADVNDWRLYDKITYGGLQRV